MCIPTAVLTTVDRKHEKEGIVTLKISYTGTTNDTQRAREEALQNEMHARASTPQQSSIRDHTGSGVGNNPDDHRPGKSGKVGGAPGFQVCLFFMRSMAQGVLLGQ